MRAKGISLHIGVNRLDLAHYKTEGILLGCENDARDMEILAGAAGFETTVLLSEQATRQNVIREIISAANKLKANDIFMISYAGHGARITDKNGDESDGFDETLCLHDAMLIDDELSHLWSKFRANVRILMIADSCHSGTASRRVSYAPGYAPEPIQWPGASAGPRFFSDGLRTYLENKGFYKEIFEHLKRQKDRATNAAILQISGCQDHQEALDGVENGMFTTVLKAIWNEGRFSGTYETFHQLIQDELPDQQSPNLLLFGKSNPFFKHQIPFTI